MDCSSGGSRGGNRGGWAPPYVSTTMRPEGPKKKKFGHRPQPPPPPFTAAMADPGEGPGARPLPLPLFFDQNEARRTEKKILGVRPPPSSQGLMTTPLPPPSLKVWIRHCAVTSARRKPRRDSEFCKRLKRERLNRSQKVCLKESE